MGNANEENKTNPENLNGLKYTYYDFGILPPKENINNVEENKNMEMENNEINNDNIEINNVNSEIENKNNIEEVSNGLKAGNIIEENNYDKVEIENKINIEIIQEKIEIKEDNYKKSDYSELNIEKNYNLRCPTCKGKIKIEKTQYDKDCNDYVIYFNCLSASITTNSYLIKLLDEANSDEEKYLSEENIEKIKEILENKNDEFEGYPILENILRANNILFEKEIEEEEEKDELNEEFMLYNNSNNPIKQILWLDENINSKESQKNLTLLQKHFQDLQIFQKEEELFQAIENIKFEIYIIIINDTNFDKYINYLLNNSIYSIPVSIIFTQNEDELKQEINLDYKNYIEHKFYNPLGVSTSMKDIIKKIKNFIIDYNKEINKIKLGYLFPPNDYKECFIFEYIDDDSKLIFPFLYNKIMKNAKLTEEEVKQMNQYILEKYGKNEQIKNLIKCLLNIENIPFNIIAKFWGRIYTIESSFYRNLNNDLMKLDNNNYNEYIQMLYVGLKEFEYKETDELYRGVNISDVEVDNILNFYKNRKVNDENEPLYLIYSRAFLSFSKNKGVSLGFLKDIPNTRKILFQLKNNQNNKILSNASLCTISVFQYEEEILFFPFSTFIIKNIINEDGIYYITLEYLGLYEKRIKEKIKTVDKKEMQKIISKSNFSKDALKLKIIPKKVEKVEKIEEHQENEENENIESIIDNIGENLINEIIEINNNDQINEIDKEDLNEINCIYTGDKDEINLLNNYSHNKEINQEMNEDNIEIFINDNPVNFSLIYKSEIKEDIKVKFKFKNFLTNLSYMFYNCSSLKSVDLSSFKSSNVTDMSFMFYKCSSLNSIDLSSFDTSNVSNMSSLFRGCSSLKKLDLNSFNTSNVKDMGEMFRGCSSLEIIYLFVFNTSNVINMEAMFENCSSLKSINLASFDTSNVINMSGMFYKCSSLKSLDLSNFNTENVTNMSSLFNGCTYLESLDIISFNTNNVIDMSSMFSNCIALKSIDFSNFIINNATKTTCMFFNCENLSKKLNYQS